MAVVTMIRKRGTSSRLKPILEEVEPAPLLDLASEKDLGMNTFVSIADIPGVTGAQHIGAHHQTVLLEVPSITIHVCAP